MKWEDHNPTKGCYGLPVKIVYPTFKEEHVTMYKLDLRALIIDKNEIHY